MQKLLRRTALVKRQAARKAAQRQGRLDSDERKLRLNEQKTINISVRSDTRAARLARHEDWLLGPLAPKRDAGDARDTYGTLDARRLRGVDKPKDQVKDWGIVEGDRVVIVLDGHRERGKIGRVREVRKEAEECFVTGLNRADVRIPDYLLLNEADKTPVRPYEVPIPLSAVRLVTPLPHPETGALRDVVIKELKLKRLKGQLRDDRPARLIAGVNPLIQIPYPEEQPEEFEDNDCDTLRIEVEERTFVPTLLRPPMPAGIIDELRNKYSKFRDRHEDAFIARKIEEDRIVEERKRSIRKMDTPLKELHRKERAEKKARGKAQLSEQMLEEIGSVMARNKVPAFATTGDLIPRGSAPDSTMISGS
ncbi:hypothetical protein MMC13_001884 [Lambiella insularis]|nr:hypothetical protein [Lambiella insularis]